MIDPVRQEIVTSAKTVVIKIGTAVLTNPDGSLDRRKLRGLVRQMHSLLDSGRQIVVVSSGAIGAGVGQLGLKRRPKDLRHLQAAAAVGQSYLIQEYDSAFRKFGYHAAQILLTAGDFEDRSRFLNVRNTLWTLAEYKAVPIINENDTVSVDELRFGDNDLLAAMVTNMLRAPLLIMLSSVAGLYPSDPVADSGDRPIQTVARIDESTTAMAGENTSELGSGGMRSKIQAASMCAVAGESVWIAGGREPRILERMFAAEPVGTVILPRGGLMNSRKRWIGTMVRPRGRILIDEGARKAIETRGKSLLPIGVRQVEGKFKKGDVVRICDLRGTEFARGLSNLSASQARAFMGLRSREIQQIESAPPYDEVIHRDNLVVFEPQ